MGVYRSSVPLSTLALFSLFLSAVLVVGCSNEDDPDEDRDTTAVAPPPSIPADSSAQADALTRRLAARFLRYSYQGASLRSTHPLNDSLNALTAGMGPGGPVTLVDTFSIDSASVAHAGSTHTVQVRVPHALTVTKVWKTSNPQSNHSFTIRIVNDKVAKAPRIVGWPALRAHVRRVEPDEGEAIVERLRTRWADLTGARPGV